MTQGILPPLSILAVVRKSVCDELVDVGQGAHLFRAVPNRHGGERYVGIRRFLVTVTFPRGSGHSEIEPEGNVYSGDKPSAREDDTVTDRGRLMKLALKCVAHTNNNSWPTRSTL